MARFADFRSYLSVLDELGDIEHVTRVVNADLEAAAITRRSTEQGRPARLFEAIAAFGAGFRIAGAPGALSSIPGHPLARVSLALGLPHTATAADLVEHLSCPRSSPRPRRARARRRWAAELLGRARAELPWSARWESEQVLVDRRHRRRGSMITGP